MFSVTVVKYFCGVIFICQLLFCSYSIVFEVFHIVLGDNFRGKLCILKNELIDK